MADFLGVSNLLSGEATAGDNGACTLRMGERTLRAAQGSTGSRGQVKAMIRPERIVVEAHGTTGENRVPGLVERSVFLGNAFEVHVRIVGGDLLKAMVPNDGSVTEREEGAAVTLHLPAEALRVLAPSTSEAEPAATRA